MTNYAVELTEADLGQLRFSVMGFFPVEKENAKMLFTGKVTSFVFGLFPGFVPR